ncbi:MULTISPECIES: hypothetical protein [unclassified Archaeoglobus]|uniref:hypothetical protein n=1 Tax=unclassified Archaeoglobus TaxID=2643606 RepID=UPI0025C299BE|nr:MULTISPECIES: hypothetical protein [unclassified Archaeoglobus]
MIKFYLLKMGDEIQEHGEGAEKYKGILLKFDEMGLKRAVILLQKDALYFEKSGVSVIVCVSRENIGAAKIFSKKIMSKSKKVDLSSLEEIFEFAEELERMNLNGIAKFLR